MPRKPEIQITAINKKPDVGALNPFLNAVWKDRAAAYCVEGPDKTLYIVVSGTFVPDGGGKWYNGFYRCRGRASWTGHSSTFTTIEAIAERYFRNSNAGVVKQMEMDMGGQIA